ncbi:tail fiber protein [Enterobacter ludwigii]|uniref:tail fiber protein n=1 Tax=Enterobacter ludwigii TaxID=299767 RepID=UPI003BEED747
MTTRPTINRLWASNDDTSVRDPGDDKYKEGWVAEIPTYQVLNFLQNRVDKTLLALGERGVFEWGSDISYVKGAVVWNETDNTIYVSLVDNPDSTKTPDTNSDEWKPSSIQISKVEFDNAVKEITDHINSLGGTNPHKLQPHDVDTYSRAEIDGMVGEDNQANEAHIQNMDNPHETTAEQAGGVLATGGEYTGTVTMGSGVTNLDTDGSAKIDATGGVLGIVVDGSGLAVDSDGKAGTVKGGVFQAFGSAADADIVTSMTDTTAGRVPVVGWMGTGGTTVRLLNDSLESKAGFPSALFSQGGGANDTRFGSYGCGVHLLYGDTGDGTAVLTANLFVDSKGNLSVEWLAISKADGSVVSQSIQKLFGPLNPDTSRVAKAGDEMTGALTAPGFINKGDYSLRNLANRHIRFEYLKNDSTWAVDGYIYKDGVDAPNRRPGVRINCGTPDKDKGNASNSGDWVFGEDGMLTCPGEITGAYKGTFMWTDQYNTRAPFYQDYTSSGTSEYHPVIKQRARLSSNAWAFSMGSLISGTDLTWCLHLRGSAGQECVHRWTTNGDYLSPGQVVPANYTNFDNRYLTKSENLPVGVPLPWPTATPPSGWLICNGSAFNKASCPQLAAVYPSGNLPDLRAQFIRGLDNGKNVDNGRVILSTQPGQSPYSSAGSTYGNQTWNNRATVKTGYYMTTGTDNDGTYQIMAESQTQRETRPTNVAFNYIVRAA